MPANVVKTARDEKLWKKAKSIVAEQYPDLSEEDDRHWKLVMGIYRKLQKTVKKGLEVRPLAGLAKGLIATPLEEMVIQAIDAERDAVHDYKRGEAEARRMGLAKIADVFKHVREEEEEHLREFQEVKKDLGG